MLRISYLQEVIGVLTSRPELPDVKLHFLGTGGARYVTGEQSRATGGIVIETEETQIHVDPGPGALVKNHEQMDEPLETDALIVSHAHLDHSNDAEAIIEMMTEAAGKPGKLYANETVLNGYGDIEKAVSDYHQDLCVKVEKLGEGTETELEDVDIRSQEMFHGDPRTVGFTVETDGKKVGFWTDTEFSEELLDFYGGCDWLVVYCTRPKGSGIPEHTSIGDVPDIVEAVEPSTCIVTHFGKALLNEGIESQKEWLEERTDVKTVFAEDRMTFPGNRSLGDF